MIEVKKIKDSSSKNNANAVSAKKSPYLSSEFKNVISPRNSSEFKKIYSEFKYDKGNEVYKSHGKNSGKNMFNSYKMTDEKLSASNEELWQKYVQFIQNDG